MSSNKKREQDVKAFTLTVEGHDLDGLTPEQHKKETIKKLIRIAYNEYLMILKTKADGQNS